MKMRRVGNYGPRCSRRFKDHYGEMLAEDYRPTLMPYSFWAEWRIAEIERITTVSPLQRLVRQ